MLICLSFSFVVYKLSIDEFDNGFRRQNAAIMLIPEILDMPGTRRELIEARKRSFATARKSVIAKLVAVNAIVLITGGFASYNLARWSLRPIKDSLEALDRFTSDASHELRTPISAMKTEIEVALMNENLKLAETKHVLKSNLEELDKLTNLTEGMLQLARLNKNYLVKAERNLESLIQSAVATIKFQADKKSIRLDINVPKNIEILADEIMFVQAISIILDNAIKYSSTKTVVMVTAKTKKKQVFIKIIDQGMGIAKTDQAKIFDRFFRSDKARNKQDSSGYGLGLAIAKSIIELHNGTIKLDSTLGKGTTFIVIVNRA